MANLSNVSLEMFHLWSSGALKSYLALRKKSVNGTFDELAARAFCAWEEKVPVDLCAEHSERQLLEDYKKKLFAGNKVLPDPYSIQDGWVKEKDGLQKWPSVYFIDIANYLNSKTPEELIKRLMNEYKEGKAYRYFSCEWVKQIEYHHISDKSSVCFLKADVCPSQSVNNKPYQVWAVVEKDLKSRPGGSIVNAYCTCTAGMLGSCNHLAGMLFRVEAAVKSGMTKPTCTSQSSIWNVPSGKTSVKPTRVSSYLWSKDHYHSAHDQAEKRNIMDLKQSFTPLTKQQTLSVKDGNTMRQRLLQCIRPGAPNSCFVQLVQKIHPRTKSNSVICPLNLIDIADALRKEKPMETDLPKLQEKLVNNLDMTPNQIAVLERETSNQSLSSEWKQQRHGRITASCFQRVFTRVKTIRNDHKTDPSPLIATVMGYQNVPTTAAMKHGLSMEPRAKMFYIAKMKKQHKKFKSQQPGISVLHEKPYISASADLLTECDCCGKGLCEIKCPASVKDQIPTCQNLAYLYEDTDGTFHLKKSHSYFFQIQGQMGILNRKHCDLFIYTSHGYITLRIQHDADFWKDLLAELDWFWLKFISRELLTHELKDKLTTVSPTTQDSPAILKDLPNICSKSTCSMKAPQKQRSNKRRKGETRCPVYLCGECGHECVESPMNVDENSVQCDVCCLWIHFRCAGIDEECGPNDDEQWTCSQCI